MVKSVSCVPTFIFVYLKLTNPDNNIMCVICNHYLTSEEMYR